MLLSESPARKYNDHLQAPVIDMVFARASKRYAPFCKSLHAPLTESLPS
jgi:hypothetical protein